MKIFSNKENIMIEMLKTKEVAELLNVKVTKVYQLIKTDNLPFIKFRRKYLYFKDSILIWKENFDKQKEEISNSLSVSGIAKILRCCYSQVDNLVKDYGLPRFQIEHDNKTQTIYRKVDFEMWLRNQEQNKPIKKQPTESETTMEDFDFLEKTTAIDSIGLAAT